MPVYEFYCNKCNNVFEYLVIGKEDKPACHKCGNKNVNKQFSVFGFSSGSKFVTSSSVRPGCTTCSTHNCATCH